jgi:hypothetical protein
MAEKSELEEGLFEVKRKETDSKKILLIFIA